MSQVKDFVKASFTGVPLPGEAQNGQPSKPLSEKPSSYDDVQSTMIAPSIINQAWFRLLVAAGVLVGLSYGSTQTGAVTLPNFVHIIGYGLWLGITMWHSFISGTVMFKNLPRQQFGKLQSKLFPWYFSLSSLFITTLLATLVSGSRGISQLQAGLLVPALLSNLINQFYIEPIVSKLMHRRYAQESKKDKDELLIKKLYKQFGMWHGISSIANLVSMISAIGYGYLIAQQATIIM